MEEAENRRIARALRDGTSQEQKELFAARMIGAPAETAAQLLDRSKAESGPGGEFILWFKMDGKTV